MRSRRLLGWALLGMVGAYVLAHSLESDRSTPGESSAARAKAEARTQSTANQRAAWGTALRRAGWNCPEVKSIWWEGETAKGTQAKVLCGPADGTGAVGEKMIFRATLRPNGVMDATPVSLQG